ncbi:MAG: hypothetical protein COA79_21475 [Planctomycetota bacterium]|nr:MAG: hypothetical protein COA79_21475 [Planctomycetota bacterium]
MRENVYDVSDKAQFYAGHSYRHYKSEVYPLFANILSTLKDGDVILDIGGGPGHLPYEFFKKQTEKSIEYWILDGSKALLKHAEGKLAGNDQIHTALIDFNKEDWGKGLPSANAIVSNNALFHLKPERICDFYTGLSGILRPNGFYLNQQSMLYAGGYHPHQNNVITKFLNKLPYDVLPQMPQFTEEEFNNMMESETEIKNRHQEEIKQAMAQKDLDPTIYYFHSVEDHLKALRQTGMEATTIWQKKEFYVILGVKE